jgi:hypothetical protein
VRQEGTRQLCGRVPSRMSMAAAVLPDADVTQVPPGAGHLIALERPGVLADLVNEVA